jgi:hypothetical protein
MRVAAVPDSEGHAREHPRAALEPLALDGPVTRVIGHYGRAGIARVLQGRAEHRRVLRLEEGVLGEVAEILQCMPLIGCASHAAPKRGRRPARALAPDRGPLRQV